MNVDHVYYKNFGYRLCSIVVLSMEFSAKILVIDAYSFKKLLLSIGLQFDCGVIDELFRKKYLLSLHIPLKNVIIGEVFEEKFNS